MISKQSSDTLYVTKKHMNGVSENPAGQWCLQSPLPSLSPSKTRSEYLKLGKMSKNDPYHNFQFTINLFIQTSCCPCLEFCNINSLLTLCM